MLDRIRTVLSFHQYACLLWTPFYDPAATDEQYYDLRRPFCEQL